MTRAPEGSRGQVIWPRLLQSSWEQTLSTEETAQETACGCREQKLNSKWFKHRKECIGSHTWCAVIELGHRLSGAQEKLSDSFRSLPFSSALPCVDFTQGQIFFVWQLWTTSFQFKSFGKKYSFFSRVFQKLWLEPHWTDVGQMPLTLNPKSHTKPQRQHRPRKDMNFKRKEWFLKENKCSVFRRKLVDVGGKRKNNLILLD